MLEHNVIDIFKPQDLDLLDILLAKIVDTLNTLLKSVNILRDTDYNDLIIYLIYINPNYSVFKRHNIYARDTIEVIKIFYNGGFISNILTRFDF